MRGKKVNTRSDSYSMIGQVGTCAPCRPQQSCLMPIPCYDPGDMPATAIGQPKVAIGPAWTRGEIEKPDGLRDMGGWTGNFYTTEQQHRLGVDENGIVGGNAVPPGERRGKSNLDIPKSCGTTTGNCDAFDNWKMNNKRCMDVGGHLDDKFNQGGDQTFDGCNGNQGTAGDISLCPGRSMKCALQNDQKQLMKVRSYYGKTDMYQVDAFSQYYKDVTKVVNNALEVLNKNKECFCSMLSAGIQPVASVDLDDTVWNTFGAMQLKFNQKKFDDSALQSKFPPIQPVIYLLKTIREMGILPVFITGRASIPAVVGETMTELDAFSKLTGLVRGYHYWYGSDVSGNLHPMQYSRSNDEVVQSNGGVFMHSQQDVITAPGKAVEKPSDTPDSGVGKKAMSATLYKATTRCWIQKNGLSGMKVKFVLSIGDQWSDSNGRCSGLKVKLPNPMYYLD
jgi:hypothetical protein